MRKKLEQMEIELRELMIYQSPPELGALWTEVNEMMEKLKFDLETAATNVEVMVTQAKQEGFDTAAFRREIAAKNP